MRSPHRITSHVWIAALIVACGFLVWLTANRIHRVEYVSGLVETEAVVDAASPTGYAGGWRHLIVPEHNSDSYQWIAQTQQMLSQKEWRVRHVDYDNAPKGRDVRSPSPYRWWLGLVAWIDHRMSGRPIGLSVEHAALVADPGVQLLLLVGAVVFAAWHFGSFPAALLGLGLVTFFPLAGEFLPGQPNDDSLAQAAALWCLLPLLAALKLPRTVPPPPRTIDPSRCLTRRWFLVAGIAGGIGLWISVDRVIPILAGVMMGGVIATMLTRSTVTNDAAEKPLILPWRIWAIGGATASFAAFLIEYFPSHMGGWRLEQIHPVYSIAWLGAGDLLERLSAWRAGPRTKRTRRTVAVTILAAAAVALVPALWLMKTSNVAMAVDSLSSRLTNLPGGPVAQNSWVWLLRDGFSTVVAATCLPAFLVGPALWLLLRRKTCAAHRAALSLALGPVLIALGLAFFHLHWWNFVDTASLALLVATSTAIWLTWKSSPGRGLWAGGVILGLAPGFMLLLAQARTNAEEVVTTSEVESLMERDLSYWLANQAGAGGAIVLAPPNLTASLHFYGGLSGLGTPYLENWDGFLAAVRIAGSNSPDEAQAVAQGRTLKYIVVPSWDPFMDEYARLGSNDPSHSLVSLLHRWQPPRWLQPVPYHLPTASGLEDHSVAVFKVVEVQDNIVALSHLAEYFAEMGQVREATAVSTVLMRSYPADLGAIVARTLVAQARGDSAAFAETVGELLNSLTRGDDKTLPWDRRVSLAIALMEAKRFDLAKEQADYCLGEVNEARLRSLTTASLRGLLKMSKAFGIPIADQPLQVLARQLLPVEMRTGL